MTVNTKTWDTKEFIAYLTGKKNLSPRSAESVAYRCHSIERIFQIDLRKETMSITAYEKLTAQIEYFCQEKFGQTETVWHNVGVMRGSVKKIAEFFWGSSATMNYPRKAYKSAF